MKFLSSCLFWSREETWVRFPAVAYRSLSFSGRTPFVFYKQRRARFDSEDRRKLIRCGGAAYR